MKKTLIAILLAGTSASVFAGDRFSNDFLRVDKSVYELDSGAEIDKLKVKASYSINEMFFVEATGEKADFDDYNVEEITYGAYLGAEIPLQVNLNSVVYVKGGYLKSAAESEGVDEKTRDNIRDVQAGFRWDYGLPRLDIKLFVGRKDYQNGDFQHTYYGADINYFLTKNFSIGGGMVKNEDTKAEEVSFNAAFHW